MVRYLFYLLVAIAVLALGMVEFSKWRAGEPTSFVSSNPDGVFFLHWTDQQGHLVGQFQAITAVGYPPQTKSENISFAGVRGGSNISLTFSAFFVSLTWTGTVTGNSLTLETPDSTGIMHTLAFSAGTVADYNKAAAAYMDSVNARAEAIRQKIAQEAALAQQQRERQAAIARQKQELARQQATVVAANDNMRTAYQGLDLAVRQLERDTDATQILKRFAQDWDIMQKHFAKFQSDASKQPLTCYQLNVVVSYDVSTTLSYDLNVRLGYDNNVAFSYWRNQVDSDQARVNNATQRFQGAAANLDNAVVANTQGTPGPAYTKGEIQSQIATATQQLVLSSSAVARTAAQKDATIRDAKALLERAKDLMAGLICSN